MNNYRFHLIANAHLDPVWLWDWREGMNEAISTSRAMLDLMEEFPELTVVRGETALYEFIEKEEPALFRRIEAAIVAGRWEFVGGTYVQSDNNLPATETLERQFQVGQEYFQSRFGKTTDTAWFPDTFGHSAGLPGIMQRHGIQNFAHCRPFPKHFPIPEHTYFWEGCDGSQVMAYRSPVDWYCHNRHELLARLDAYLEAAKSSRLQDIAIFYGVGNHGGGPTRRMLRELRLWSTQHPEVELIHSGLSRYFAAVRKELAARPDLSLPVVRGELNFDSRGCYASMAKFKHAYRRAEAQVIRAEIVDRLVRDFLKEAPSDFTSEWRAILFNSFHDILPGSSIERAYDDQLAHVGGAFHSAQAKEFAAINTLARTIDTSTGAPPHDDHPTAASFLLINPHNDDYYGIQEWEAQLDWRPIAAYDGPQWESLPVEVLGPDGQPVPFQKIQTEHRCTMSRALRVRVAVQVDVPARSWQVFTVGYKENPDRVHLAESTQSQQAGAIANSRYTVSAEVGSESVRVEADGAPLLEPGLGAWLYDDIYGAWGGILEEPESYFLTSVAERWKVAATSVLESGPLLSRLWVRLAGQNSRLDLKITLSADEDIVRFEGRLFLNEKSKRIKLVMPGFTTAEFEVPGGSIVRTPCGEVPALRWVKAFGESKTLGFASDVISCFDLRDNLLQATLARTSRYADDTSVLAGELPHLPITDQGELRFRFLMKKGGDNIENQAVFCSQPLLVQMVPAQLAVGPRQGRFR